MTGAFTTCTAKDTYTWVKRDQYIRKEICKCEKKHKTSAVSAQKKVGFKREIYICMKRDVFTRKTSVCVKRDIPRAICAKKKTLFKSYLYIDRTTPATPRAIYNETYT